MSFGGLEPEFGLVIGTRNRMIASEPESRFPNPGSSSRRGRVLPVIALLRCRFRCALHRSTSPRTGGATSARYRARLRIYSVASALRARLPGHRLRRIPSSTWRASRITTSCARTFSAMRSPSRPRARASLMHHRANVSATSFAPSSPAAALRVALASASPGSGVDRSSSSQAAPHPQHVGVECGARSSIRVRGACSASLY